MTDLLERLKRLEEEIERLADWQANVERTLQNHQQVLSNVLLLIRILRERLRAPGGPELPLSGEN